MNPSKFKDRWPVVAAQLDAVHKIKQLETELAEAAAKIAALTQALVQESRKAADFERLVMDGELVPSARRKARKETTKEKQNEPN